MGRLVSRAWREDIRRSDQQRRSRIFGDTEGRVDHDRCIVDRCDIHGDRTGRDIIDVVANRVGERYRSVVVGSRGKPDGLGRTDPIKRNRSAFGRLGNRDDASRGSKSVDVVGHNIVAVDRRVFVDGKDIVDRSEAVLDVDHRRWQ